MAAAGGRQSPAWRHRRRHGGPRRRRRRHRGSRRRRRQRRGARRDGGGTAGRGGDGGGIGGARRHRRWRRRARRHRRRSAIRACDRPRSATTTASTTTATTWRTAPTPGCFGDPRCAPPGQEVCNNNLDDDEDGRIDCADPDCMGSPACRPTRARRSATTASTTTATSWWTARIRSARRSRAASPCRARPTSISATIATHGASVSRDDGHARRRQGVTRPARPRAASAASDDSSSTRRPTSASTSSRRSGSAHVVGLFRAGANQACDRNPVDCVNAMDNPTREAFVLGAAARRLLDDRRVLSEPAGRDERDAVDRRGRDAGDLRQRHRRRRQRPDRLPGRACLRQPRVVRRQPVRPRPQHRHAGRQRAGASATVGQPGTATDDYQSTCSAGVAGRRHRDRVHAGRGGRAGGPVQADRAQHLRALSACPAAGLACDADQRSCAFQDDAGELGRVRQPVRGHATCSSSRRRAPPWRASINLRLLGVQRPARRDLRQQDRRRHQRADRLRRSGVLRRRRLPGARVRARSRTSARSRGEPAARSTSIRAPAARCTPTSCSRGTGQASRCCGSTCCSR